MKKDFEHKNKWALILGGSSGLGLASAQKLAAHGLNICIVHRDSRNKLHQIQQQFETIRELDVELISFNLDALKKENQTKILNVLKGKGIIKVLIHSIAKGNLKPIASKEEPTLQTDDFSLTLNAMAVSLYSWAKAIFDNQQFSKNAKVIAFTSEGSARAWKYYAAVSAAKAALESIVRSIALELAPYRITANCIQAGVTNTESLRMIPTSKQLKEHSKKRNPFQRLTTPQDVANMVYLLCKKEANWVNGTVIKVDGGESLN